ncbi:hypothetical protein ACEN8I_21925 [Polaromonas sp. CT11-55]|uniref:hypothetical protein n=1 Tax=Polaromonas sp. CT11-55 TaxID=3243045 RepID=UPI0039A431BC
MATPNYSYEKRQKELAKKRKKEEKLKRKAEGKQDDAVDDESAAPPADGNAPAGVPPSDSAP